MQHPQQREDATDLRRTETPVAVVTGAGQGIGASFARKLHELGYAVALLDVNRSRVQQIAEELHERALAVVVDVSDVDQVRAAREEVVQRFGRVDVLVNCAALFSSLEMKAFEDITAEEWDAVMAVNVRGVFLCCKEFSLPMREAGFGRIVNMSSGTVWMGRPNYLHYVTSKAALVGFTRALARELGEDGITVNAIAPGSTATEVSRDSMQQADVVEIIAKQAIKFRQRTDDLFSALAFLVDPASGFVTGQTVIVDGGVVFS
jgi:3-oxoacyl-[acyl-carrier protein] reductase